MNTVFIPEFDHEDFVLPEQQDLGSLDVVSLREGLGTSDGQTGMSNVVLFKMVLRKGVQKGIL